MPCMRKRTFDELVQLMQKLRGPDGCPWDRKQTLPSLKPFVIEESYEVVDAIDRDDRAALAEELGDFLLQAVFIAELTREEGSFDIYDAITAIHDKLVRRHPHVFGDVEANDAEEVLVNWEKLKNEEAKAENKSVLAGVPQSMPALLRASRLTEKPLASVSIGDVRRMSSTNSTKRSPSSTRRSPLGMLPKFTMKSATCFSRSPTLPAS